MHRYREQSSGYQRGRGGEDEMDKGDQLYLMGKKQIFGGGCRL